VTHRIIVLVLFLGSVLALNADTIRLNALDSGWYMSDGFHSSTNQNYVAGNTIGLEHRDFFVFDLSGVSGPITSAELSLFNPCATCAPENFDGYLSPNASETYQVTNVNTPVATLEASNTGAVSIFSDLGTNTLYGAQSVSAADDGQQVLIALNGDAIAALSASTGLFAFGGRLIGLPANPARADNEVIFAATDGVPTDKLQLILTTAGGTTSAVPEPAALPIAGAALLAVSVLNRTRPSRDQSV